ncbi:hypothetical protein ABIE38_002324 [Dietzia sp. 2505]|uniref:hypothetical protein n=1 Tax=Dietzia sp. 2505 TaxID=3156457 RepID=UPI00339878A6
MNSRLLPLIAFVVVVIDAILLATGVIGPATALALFLAVEVPLGVIAVTGYVRRYRAHRADTGTRADALRALAAEDPYLRLIGTEARTLASLARWVTRRPDITDGAATLGYSCGTLGIPVAIAVGASLELIAVHLLVPWPEVRLVLACSGSTGCCSCSDGWPAGSCDRI